MDPIDVQCGVCFDTMVKPMVLRCGHSFCELCAEESINFSDKCPLCRQKSVGICIFNRSLDQCIQSWMTTQDKAIKEAYRQRVAQYSKILLLKNKARIILWTVISRSRNDGVRIDDVERLYNEIQNEWGRQTVEFDTDLKEQIRREALLHDGCFFKLFKDDNCTLNGSETMLPYSAITFAPDYASTSNFHTILTKNGTYSDDWISGTGGTRNDFGAKSTTTSNWYSICESCGRGSSDLAQSFVLYFAPTVIVVALIMCIARLLFVYGAFRRHAVANMPPPPTSATASGAGAERRRHHQHTVVCDDDHNNPMSYHTRGSFADIFMQPPPPSYEQAQKYGATPFESSNDRAPPPYAYQNPSCVAEEQPSTESATIGHTIVTSSSPTDASNSTCSGNNESEEGRHTNGTTIPLEA